MEKRIVKVSIFCLELLFVIIMTLICFRYFKYRELIGKYKLVDDEVTGDTLQLKLFGWSRGNKDKLKCDIWGCSGYEKGTIYYVKNGKMYFRFDKYNLYVVDLKIEEDKNKTYLIEILFKYFNSSSL